MVSERNARKQDSMLRGGLHALLAVLGTLTLATVSGCAASGSGRPAEICDNGSDDDHDGYIDCDDSDCVEAAWCVVRFEVCDNGQDDDGDGLADCDDPDCAATALCLPGAETCDNGGDDDHDGLADCDDPDCASTAWCAPTLEICDNGSDDDGDGHIDCDDPDCAATALCLPGAEICDNGSDDDGDGHIDCDDPDCAGAAACNTNDPCFGASNGNHCGADLSGQAVASSVYACSGGVTQSITPCTYGCTNGICNTPPSDPCASANAGNGDYCGENLSGGTPGDLYTCQNGSTVSRITCPNGCKVNPPGYADVCNPSGDPCASANGGDGPYCGGNLTGGLTNVLYQCQGGVTVSQTTCPNGCQMNPPGTPDACIPSGGGSCCIAQPPGSLTQSFNACGGGGIHYGMDYISSLGTPIYAGIAGTVVGTATGYPNCYQNGCTEACYNSFNYVKIRADCGDPHNSANDLYVYYLHIDDLAPGIANGVHVAQGELIAYVGNSGCSSTPHIHLEVVSVPSGQTAYLHTCYSEDPSGYFCP